MDCQNIDINRLSKGALGEYNVEDLIFIYLSAYQIPLYYASTKLVDTSFSKILYKEFKDFIKETSQLITFNQFIEGCTWWWNLIPLSTDPKVHIKRSLPEFSYYSKPISNISPRTSINLKQVFEVIKNPKYFKNQTLELRQISDLNKRRQYKTKSFDYVTFSGTFSKRNSQSVLNQSGYLCLDIDHVQTDINLLKTSLIDDYNLNVQLLFVSPSGDGLKVVILYDPKRYGILETFELLEDYFLQVYNIQIDKACKNIDRACFLCHDEDAYINPKI